MDAAAPQPTNYAALFFGVRGRFSRSQAWAGFAMCVFLHLAGSSAFELFGRALGALYWPTFLLAAVIDAYVAFLLVTIGIRRCHDRDRSAMWLALGLTGLGIPVLAFELGLLQGTIGSNRFGPDPLQDTDAIRRAFESADEAL